MLSELPVLDNKAGKYRGDGFMQSGCNPDAKCGNGLEKVYPTCAVRYGYMRYLGEFKYSPGMKFNCGGKVVIQTNRGIELGEQISLTCSGCDKSINRKQILEYTRQSGPEFLGLKAGRILRVATPADLDEQTHLNMSAAHELVFARGLVRTLELPMKFVTCEHLLGGERIIFHFMSEDRIDFRELVRQLAQEYHTRIEMHQVGARDEARLVADYEICGRECCCKNFLKKLRQVNMKMAKLQKATLDPSKVSGRCGRLRCCLRYEHEGYEELNKKLPKVGSRVRTDKGIATIRDRQILTQLLSVIYDGSNEWETIPLEDIVERGLPRLEEPPEDLSPRRDRPGARPDRPQREPDPRDRREPTRPAPQQPEARRPEVGADRTVPIDESLSLGGLKDQSMSVESQGSAEADSGFASGIIEEHAPPGNSLSNPPQDVSDSMRSGPTPQDDQPGRRRGRRRRGRRFGNGPNESSGRNENPDAPGPPP
ncbi:MAG TPA: regulatory iron-sulfur-containing complex subunit RicT [Phycisphaerae bacterium]|nr:regulatory iron-sulfur-containing complex subunit RicT [Phycisphaerae bacterium]